jgi:AcrR family transcriptional regulator
MEGPALPPKSKVTKEAITAAALELVRAGGLEALNARAVARRLGCSTQPIFSNFPSMEALRASVVDAAQAVYQDFLARAMAENTAAPPYKASGLSYIRFAREERHLFRLLFMRDRTGEPPPVEDRVSIAPLLALIRQNTGLSEDDAYLFHMEMWIFVHGIAAMSATAYLDWNDDLIDRMLSDAFLGIRQRWTQREGTP